MACARRPGPGWRDPSCRSGATSPTPSGRSSSGCRRPSPRPWRAPRPTRRGARGEGARRSAGPPGGSISSVRRDARGRHDSSTGAGPRASSTVRPVRAMLDRWRRALTEAPPAVTLGYTALLLLLLAFWWRAQSFGLSAWLLDGTEEVLSLAPDAPVPAGRVVTTYLSPLRDPGGYFQQSHMVEGWTERDLPRDQLPPARVVMRGEVEIPE